MILALEYTNHGIVEILKITFGNSYLVEIR